MVMQSPETILSKLATFLIFIESIRLDLFCVNIEFSSLKI